MMDAKEKVRKQVWIQLQNVARPDSRFHWDFNQFIPDFEGSEFCTERICETVFYQEAGTVFVTPDNSLVSFRTHCFLDGKTLIIPTYGLGRGFLQIERSDIPYGMEELAATLDGLERFAKPYPITRGVYPVPELLVSGASVLNRDGVRITNHPSYFDLEWLILSFLDLITPRTPVITSVHDCQVVDMVCDPTPFSVGTDLIVTPTAVIETAGRYPRPEALNWGKLPRQIIEEVPLLRELYFDRII